MLVAFESCVLVVELVDGPVAGWLLLCCLICCSFADVAPYLLAALLALAVAFDESSVVDD